jgi:hypothetical protein
MSSNCCFILDLQNHIPYNLPVDKYDWRNFENSLGTVNYYVDHDHNTDYTCFNRYTFFIFSMY